MQIGNLVRPLRQPIDAGDILIDLSTLGVIVNIAKGVFKVRWPDGRILTFKACDLEDLG